jgi:hypothetical protein
MTTIELRHAVDDPESPSVSEGWLDLGPDGRVRFHGVQPRTVAMISRLVNASPSDPQGTRYTIEDGEPWLKALPFNYHGSYWWATEVSAQDEHPSQPMNPGGSI